jgi:hypothetical protein
VIEAPLVKKRKLKKWAEPTVPVVVAAIPLIEIVAPTVKKINVAGFLVARRSQVPPPSMPRVEEVAVFLANEPVLAVLVNVVGLVPYKRQRSRFLSC